jgi:hypothetical protein
MVKHVLCIHENKRQTAYENNFAILYNVTSKVNALNNG